MASLTFSFSQCLRHAFMSGAGYGDLDKISEEDQHRFCEYDPPAVGSFKRISEALACAEPKTYDIGDRTMERVFKAAGLTDVSDLQAVFNAVEKALPPAAVEPTDNVTNAMLDSARHLMMWLDFGRPTERALLEHCRRLGKTPPPECRDVDHVPPKAMRLFWIYREMRQAMLQAAQPPAAPRLVILESPYAGDIEANVAYARAAMFDCLARGEAPFASHLLYTQVGVLDDSDPAQRARGIEAGLAWGRHAVASVVYTDCGISAGMKQGIDRAEAEGRVIEYRSILEAPGNILKGSFNPAADSATTQKGCDE